MQRLVFPGSFDPPTLGHADIIQRSLKLCDELILAILENPEKTYLFSLEERLRFLRKIADQGEFKGRVRVLSHQGLLVDLCKDLQASAVVRGVRNFRDYQYEAEMAIINQGLNSRHESIFLVAKPELQYLSSSAVRSLLSFNADCESMIPEACREDVRDAYLRKKTRGF